MVWSFDLVTALAGGAELGHPVVGMKTAGSRKIVDSPDGWQWLVMGNEDGSYTAWRCELIEGRTFARSWMAVEAVQQGTAHHG